MESFSDLISVIIPIYNLENYLERCLKSVAGQTYQNLQIILIDDGSTDNSLQLCNQWKESDSRIEVYHKQNGGVSSARNLGIEKADGEWMIFVDGDDWIESNMLQRMHERAVATGADVAICSFVIENEISKEITSVFKTDICSDIISGRSAVESIVNRRMPYDVANSPGNKLFRKKIIVENHISFPVNRVVSEDMLYSVKALLAVKNCVLLPDALYHYFRIREGNSFSKKNNMKLIQDDIELKIIRTKYLNKKGETYLAEWSQDDLLYCLLMRYVSYSDMFPEDDERIQYIKTMLKKRIKAKDKKTKVGIFLYRLHPALFVWVMRKAYSL